MSVVTHHMRADGYCITLWYSYPIGTPSAFCGAAFVRFRDMGLCNGLHRKTPLYMFCTCWPSWELWNRKASCRMTDRPVLDLLPGILLMCCSSSGSHTIWTFLMTLLSLHRNGCPPGVTSLELSFLELFQECPALVYHSWRVDSIYPYSSGTCK